MENIGNMAELDELLVKALNLDGKQSFLPSEDCIQFKIYTLVSTLIPFIHSNSASNSTVTNFVPKERNIEQTSDVACSTKDNANLTDSLNNPYASSLNISSIQTSIIDYFEKRTKNYLWQKNPIQLEFINQKPDSEHCLIHLVDGYCQFGDNINDEWFIVKLLLELSSKIPTLVIEAQDTDGQFILIECAEHLPSWLRPEHSSNRVFICNGSLHLISLELSKERPSLNKSIQWILDPTISTLASVPIQRHLNLKLDQLELKPNLHCARVRVTREIASVLTRCPQLISPVIEAIYTRDPIAMRYCEKMQRFSPLNQESVECSVVFTRCLYAQLTAIQFKPPSSFSSSVSFTGQSFIINQGKKTKEQEEEQAKVLGMKLMCGFEILFQDPMYRKQPWSHTPQVTLKHHLDRLLNLPLLDITELNQASPDSDEWLCCLEEEFKQWQSPLNATTTPSSSSSASPCASSDAATTAEKEKLKSLFQAFEQGESEFDGVDCDSNDNLSNPSSDENHGDDSDDASQIDPLSEDLFNFDKFMTLLDSNSSTSPSTDPLPSTLVDPLTQNEPILFENESSDVDDVEEVVLDSASLDESQGHLMNDEELEKAIEQFLQMTKTEMGSGPASTFLASLSSFNQGT